jgi:hypothetical protein
MTANDQPGQAPRAARFVPGQDKVVEVSIEIDESGLRGYTDAYLAAAWHVAQMNPAPHGDRVAGELVERIGREIIRRWLGSVEPQLWHHQGNDYYWSELRKLATYEPGGPPGSPEWSEGAWVPKAPSDPAGTTGQEPGQ